LFDIPVFVKKFRQSFASHTSNSYLDDSDFAKKPVFDRICSVILVGYSRSRTNIYLRDKVLDEKREVSNRFTVDARCQSTMPSSAKLKFHGYLLAEELCPDT